MHSRSGFGLWAGVRVSTTGANKVNPRRCWTAVDRPVPGGVHRLAVKNALAISGEYFPFGPIGKGHFRRVQVVHAIAIGRKDIGQL